MRLQGSLSAHSRVPFEADNLFLEEEEEEVYLCNNNSNTHK